MTYLLPPSRPAASDTPPDDVPVDERPPYGRPRSAWRTALVVGLVVLLVVAAVLAARRLFRWLAAAATVLRYEAPPERGSEMIILPETPYAGVAYGVRFYDGTYSQLTDVDLQVVLDLQTPGARVQLAGMARELQRRVEQRDGQRCFAPRLELVDAAGRVVGEWP